MVTRITDGSGTRWVNIPQPKQRKSPRALRFANLKVGDQLVQKPKADWHRKIPVHYIVTDLWFDPVAGQDDPVAGQMVGYKTIRSDGEPMKRKSATTLRGLASQQFEYATVDYIAQCRAAVAAQEEGKVIGIGYGRVIRERPKIPGNSL